MDKRPIFQIDDYDQLYSYFLPLREHNRVDADPSGWMDVYSLAEELLPDITFRRKGLSHYKIDEGNCLGETKDKIVSLLSEWEAHTLDSSNVTMYHSVSEAAFATLVLLRRRGVSTIFFETPAYGVTINQAKYLGLAVELCPTYHDESYRVPLTDLHIGDRSPCAIWLTQPRMSLGINQSLKYIAGIVDQLSSNDFLVIDEATEQYFPSHLCALWNPTHVNIIRLRGFLKGAGLNGVRLAFALHHPDLRSMFEASQEVLGSSLDAFSLQTAASIAALPGKLKQLLHIANRQTTGLRAKAEKISSHTCLTVSRLENGYIGSAMINLRGDYETQRRMLLDFCLSRRMPVLLGASMRFAFDPHWERVRINYFSHEHHVIRGINNLIEFADSL